MIVSSEISNMLFGLQSVENNGNGIQCVRYLVNTLEKEITQEELIAAILWDWDKISKYPTVANFIKENIYNCDLMYVVD